MINIIKRSENGNYNYIIPDEEIIHQMFEMSHETMTRIVPFNDTKENGYKIWRESYEKRKTTGSRYILLFNDKELKGYLAYNLRSDKKDISIEDLIIKPEYQGEGRTALRLLIYFLKEIDKTDLNLIRAYTNKLNKRMQGLLSKCGF